MPHQCTECGTIHKDGSDSILEGCSNCGNNKFQFVTVEEQDKIESDEEDDIILADEVVRENEDSDSIEDSVQRNARTEIVSQSELDRHERSYQKDNDSQLPPSTKEESEQQLQETSDKEDIQQISKDMPSDPPLSVERDVSKIKDNLNTQFEGIRVIEQGKYEINLTQLFERNTQIISVQEDGKYIINVPETFKDSEDESERS